MSELTAATAQANRASPLSATVYWRASTTRICRSLLSSLIYVYAWCWTQYIENIVGYYVLYNAGLANTWSPISCIWNAYGTLVAYGTLLAR